MSGLTFEKMIRMREMLFNNPDPYEVHPDQLVLIISEWQKIDLYGGWRRLVKRRIKFLRRIRK